MKKLVSLLSILLFILCPVLVKAQDETVVSKNNWCDWQNESYWEWHVRETKNDKAYNGKHIEFKNDIIYFYGYGQMSYKDYLYKKYTNSGKKIFKFIMDESKANYHTLDGAGFIFNANKKSNKLTGYMILFREKDVCLYKVNNVDTRNLEQTANKTIADYSQLIMQEPKTATGKHELEVIAQPSNITLKDNKKTVMDVDLDETKHVGDSFGILSSYTQHDCKILSTIQFYQLSIKVEDYEEPQQRRLATISNNNNSNSNNNNEQKSVERIEKIEDIDNPSNVQYIGQNTEQDQQTYTYKEPTSSTNEKSNSKQQIIKEDTESKNNLPYTGIDSTALLIFIIISIAVGVISYIRVKKIKC